MNARAATASELLLLRDTPVVVFTALINQVSFGESVTEITYDGGVGTYGDIKAGMFLWVGDGAGLHNKGIAHIRTGATATVIYIDATDYIDFADNQYLTIYLAPRQKSKLYLAGTEAPPAVFACLVNQSFATHDKVASIIYDTITTGAYTDIVVGQDVWIGTFAGGYDVGMARIRKTPTSAILYIGEGSEIAWADNLYVTVVDQMSVWAKHPRNISKVPVMDYDVAYTDQHVKFDPVPIMGANVVLDVESYPVTVTFPDAVNSWVFDSTISAWLWTATAGTLTGGTTNNPTLTINSYPTDGYIRVALRVTSAAGADATGYRYVRIYDATHRPVTDFVLNDCSGDYSDGGFSFSVTMNGSATKTLIRDRAPMTLFATDYYGATKISLGQAAGREAIVCTGWVDGESITENPTANTVSFTVEGAQSWLSKIAATPITLEKAKNTPSKWIDITALTLDRALWHLFHWRSNVTSICDVILTGDTKYAVKAESAAATLFEQSIDISKPIFASCGFDQYGRLFAGVEPQMIPEADRTWATIQDITKTDWVGSIDIKRVVAPETSMIVLSSKHMNSSGGSTVFYSLANGHIDKRLGKVETIDNVLSVSQSTSNQLSGLYAGWKNNELPDIGISLAANNRMFTLFPHQFVHITIAANDTERGIAYNINLIPRSISYEWDSAAGALTTTLGCEAETFEELSTDGDIPDDDSEINIHIPPIPPIPPLPIPIPISTPNNTDHPKVVVAVDSSAYKYGIFYTENFNEADQTKIVWQTMNEGLTEAEYSTVGRIVITPNGKLFIMCDGNYSAGYNKIYWAERAGATWKLLITADNRVGDLTSTGLFHALGASPVDDEKIAVLGEVTYNAGFWHEVGRFLEGNSSGIAITHIMDSYREEASTIIWTQAGWDIFTSWRGGVVISPQRESAVFNTLGPFGYDAGQQFLDRKFNSLDFDTYFIWYSFYAVTCGTQGISFYWNNTNLYGKTNGTTKTIYTTLAPNGIQAMSPTPTGQNIMAASDSVFTPYRSRDGGATWYSMAAVIPAGNSVWENCGDENRWIFGGGTNMNFTLDCMNNNLGTYFTKQGNLTYLFPLCNITQIKFVSDY